MMKSSIIIILLVSYASCQQYDDQQEGGYEEQSQQQRQGGYQDQQQQQENEGSLGGENAVDVNVPEPPSQIPETSFVCDDKPYDPGMYADMETGCRVYHLCYRSRKESFICGTGTMFNQEILSCDYPKNVECEASASFYSANTEFGKGSPEPSGNQQDNQKPQGGSSGRDYGGQAPQPQQQPDDSYQQRAPAPAPRPRPPPAPRPQQRQKPQPSYSAGKPAPARPARPQPSYQQPAAPPRAPSKARPQRPRPQPRPQVVQRQEDESY